MTAELERVADAMRQADCAARGLDVGELLDFADLQDSERSRWMMLAQAGAGRLLHDLYTPLTVVQGFAELLIAAADDARRRECVEAIRSAAQDIRRIISAEAT